MGIDYYRTPAAKNGSAGWERVSQNIRALSQSAQSRALRSFGRARVFSPAKICRRSCGNRRGLHRRSRRRRKSNNTARIRASINRHRKREVGVGKLDWAGRIRLRNYEKNSNYKSVPELKKLKLRDLPELGIKNGAAHPILDLKNSPEKLDWLVNSEKYMDLLTIKKLYKEI